MSELGVALVGYGYWGKNLGRALARGSGIRLVGVADASEANRKGAERDLGVSQTWPGLEPVLECDEVEAVVLATPASTHAALALEVIASGRHVLVEKPLATTVEDARRVEAAATEAKVVAAVGHTFLYSAPVRWLKSAIEYGRFGRILYVSTQRLNLGRVRSDCNALWNLAPHDIAMITYLLGAAPSRVSGMGYSYLQPGIDDVFFGSMQNASGPAAGLQVSWLDPRKIRQLTVVGDEKMAVFDDVSPDRKVTIFDSGVSVGVGASLGDYRTLGEFQWRTRAGDITIPKIELREPLAVEVEEFARACTEGAPLASTARSGVEVVEVLTAFDRSVAQGGAAVEVRG